jgi:hypothetical protein
MTSAERRRSPRSRADWPARLHIDANDEWRECRVIDISVDGAALSLFGATLIEGLEGPIHLAIRSVVGEEAGTTIPAIIRRRLQLPGRRVVVGVEFAVLRPEERDLLQLLVGLRAQP